MTPTVEVVKSTASTSPFVLLPGTSVGMAVLLIVVAIAVTLAAGALVDVKLVAREEGSVVNIAVKMMPNDAKNGCRRNEDMCKRQWRREEKGLSYCSSFTMSSDNREKWE